MLMGVGVKLFVLYTSEQITLLLLEGLKMNLRCVCIHWPCSILIITALKNQHLNSSGFCSTPNLCALMGFLNYFNVEVILFIQYCLLSSCWLLKVVKQLTLLQKEQPKLKAVLNSKAKRIAELEKLVEKTKQVAKEEHDK